MGFYSSPGIVLTQRPNWGQTEVFENNTAALENSSAHQTELVFHLRNSSVDSVVIVWLSPSLCHLWPNTVWHDVSQCNQIEYNEDLQIKSSVSFGKHVGLSSALRYARIYLYGNTHNMPRSHCQSSVGGEMLYCIAGWHLSCCTRGIGPKIGTGIWKGIPSSAIISKQKSVLAYVITSSIWQKAICPLKNPVDAPPCGRSLFTNWNPREEVCRNFTWQWWWYLHKNSCSGAGLEIRPRICLMWMRV